MWGNRVLIAGFFAREGRVGTGVVKLALLEESGGRDEEVVRLRQIGFC